MPSDRPTAVALPLALVVCVLVIAGVAAPPGIAVGEPLTITAPQDPAAGEAALALDRPSRRLIQQGLRNEGFEPGTPNGLFGPRTRAAIRDWQQSRGASPMGYLNGAEAEFLRTAAVPPLAVAENSPLPQAAPAVELDASSAAAPPASTVDADANPAPPSPPKPTRRMPPRRTPSRPRVPHPAPGTPSYPPASWSTGISSARNGSWHACTDLFARRRTPVRFLAPATVHAIPSPQSQPQSTTKSTVDEESHQPRDRATIGQLRAGHRNAA